MQKTIPPFHENWDNSHCFQCSLRGILEKFEPKKQWTWPELEVFTDKEPDKWTWPYRCLLNMIDRGYDILSINSSNLQEYIDLGVYEAMVKNLGLEAANKQREMADLERVKVDLEKYWTLVQQGVAKRLQRVPTINDLKDLLSQGYLISSMLNSRILDGREGYSSHMVLVYDIDDTHVHFHDSGLPPQPERKETIELFVKASTNPTPQQWGITAYKKL